MTDAITQLSFLNRPTFGFGAIQGLNEVVAGLGLKRPLICTDPGMVSNGMIESVRDVLSNEYGFELFSDVPPNPTQDAVEAAVAQYKDGNCDGVIAFGGGSSIDLSKAVCSLVHNGGGVEDYAIGAGGTVDVMAPLVAIPTTSGTGSEVSNAAVIVLRDGRKVIIAGAGMIPHAAICDPGLTTGLPPKLTAGAGMDAVTHCIEALLVPSVNPPAEAVGLDGLERAIRNGHLRAAVADGTDKDARWNMMLTSTQGAMAFTKGLGIVHAMSHACGAMKEWGLHHGTLNGVILPTVLRFNAGHCGDKYDRLTRAMGLETGTDLADYIENLNSDIGLPANLSEMGVQKDKYDFLIDHCMADICHFTSPRLPTKDEYVTLFDQAMGVA